MVAQEARARIRARAKAVKAETNPESDATKLIILV